MSLFIDDHRHIELDKVAGHSTKLSDDPNDWSSEILNQFYRQVPYAHQFDVMIDLSMMDKENRTSMGQIILTTKSVKPKEGEETRENAKIVRKVKRVRVPVIISHGELQPFDVFLAKGRVYPLSERRVRRALFRPDLFDIITQPAKGTGFGTSMAPPYRFGAGHQSWAVNPSIKISSAIMHTIRKSEVDDWERTLNNDVHLKEAALGNEAVLKFLDNVSRSAEMAKTASIDIMIDTVEPTAVQLYFDDNRGSYIFKKASRKFYRPLEMELNRKEALELVGPELIKAADLQGPQTVTTEPAPQEPVKEDPMGPVTEPGLYKVRTPTGNMLVGYVFTPVYDFDNKLTPMAIFTDKKGEVASVQNEILGSKAWEEDGIRIRPPRSDEEPSGFGIFWKRNYSENTGSQVCAYGPCTVIGKVLTPEGMEFRVELFGGGEATLVKSDKVGTPTKTMDGRYVIPDHVNWAPLGKLVGLAETPEEAQKLGSAEGDFRHVTLSSGGSTFTFRGPVLGKISSANTTDLDYKDAEFLAALIGYDPGRFEKKASEAKYYGKISMERCLPITPAEETVKKAQVQARDNYEEVKHLKVDLLKEAAFVPDPDSVDAMLSLKFLTPENVAVFVNYVSDLELAAQRLAELLLAVRSGLKDLSEDALLKGMKHIDNTIEGLEKLRQIEN
jgi:hypothetical protein